jgi:hypothetical protein
MSSVKRALRQVIRAWRAGEGPAPQMLRRCDACGEEAWRPLDRSIHGMELDAWLADGRRADLALRNRAGRIRLVIQLEGGSRLANRSETAAGAPLLIIDGTSVERDPLRWRVMRERGMPKWRCRCAQARALPVDDGFSLRVIGCPLNLRRHESGPSASVIHDCARCGFFVGIGYSDHDRRRVALYCSFGASSRPRLAPLAALRLAPPPSVQAAPDVSSRVAQ